MTAASTKFDDASRYAWACSVFGLKPGASQQAVRAAIMSHLDDADFVPPIGWRQAIRLLCEPQSPQAWPESGYDAFHEAVENSLAEEVDQFATQFFSLPRGRRRLKWTELLKQAAVFPRLRARLASLQPGLDAEDAAPDGQNQQDSILVDRLRRLFVLKPGAQDAQRRQWLAAMTGDWRPVVRRVRAKYPKLTGLDTDFLSALLPSRRGAAIAETHVAIADQKTNAAIAANTNLAAAFIRTPKTSAGGSIPLWKRMATTSNSAGSSGFSRYWLLFIVLSAVGRIVSSMNSGSTNNYYSPSQPTNSRELNEFLKRLPKPIGSAGRIPFNPPLPGAPGYWDPHSPSSTDGDNREAKDREKMERAIQMIQETIKKHKDHETKDGERPNRVIRDAPFSPSPSTLSSPPLPLGETAPSPPVPPAARGSAR